MRHLDLIPGKCYWATLKAIKRDKLVVLSSVFPELFTALERTLTYQFTPQENKLLNHLWELRDIIRTCTTKLTLSHSQKRFNVSTRNLVDRTSVPNYYGVFLFRLLRELQPELCLEIGTCIGISAAYQAIALKLNDRGMMFSLEDQQTLVTFARYLLENLGLDNVHVVYGHASLTMDRVLQEYGPIDYAFIDGDHKEHRTLSFFDKVVSNFSDRGVVILDDIWSNLGMIRAWRAIKRDSRVKVSASHLRMGICLIDKKISTMEHFML
jgi:predicted O-methyltransferase YrrM